jgi:hypothetical protein
MERQRKDNVLCVYVHVTHRQKYEPQDRTIETTMKSRHIHIPTSLLGIEVSPHLKKSSPSIEQA